MSRRRGLTLIEMLAALAIVSLIVVSAYTIITSTLRTWRRSEIYARLHLEGAAVARIMRDDFACIVYRRGRVNFKVGEKNGFVTIDFVSCAWNPFTGVKVPVEVGYYLKPASDDTYALYRRMDPELGDITRGGRAVLVYERVERWSVRFFDGNGWKEEWKDSTRPPSAVEVTLVMRSRAGGEVTVSESFLVPASPLRRPFVLSLIGEHIGGVLVT